MEALQRLIELEIEELRAVNARLERHCMGLQERANDLMEMIKVERVMIAEKERLEAKIIGLVNGVPVNTEMYGPLSEVQKRVISANDMKEWLVTEIRKR